MITSPGWDSPERFFQKSFMYFLQVGFARVLLWDGFGGRGSKTETMIVAEVMEEKKFKSSSLKTISEKRKKDISQFILQS